MSEPKRPTVGFSLEVREAGKRVVDANGRVPWFPFPGGSDWNSAVVTACRETWGKVPTTVRFEKLVDDENHDGEANPWIGVCFTVSFDET